MLRLTELFSEYRPREPLADLVSGAEVCAAQIDQAARRVTAQVRFAAYAPVAALDELQTDLSRCYGIASVVLEPQFPPEAVEQMPVSELTEVLRRVIDFAFDGLGLNRVEADHFAENPASGRVMEKAGMTKEGYARQKYCKNGVFHDAVLYGILKEDRK